MTRTGPRRSAPAAVVHFRERGHVYFAYRPKADLGAARGADDVQRLYMVLSPNGKDSLRLLVIGQKRLPAVAGVAMVAAAFFVAILDGLGPVPFLRAVRVHERTEMTAVYRTYLDASELLPPLAYFFLFQLGGYATAFAALAALLAGIGALTLRHLPRGM